MGYIEDLRQEELNDLEKVKKILDRVVYFGGFEDGYKYLSHHLNSNALASKTLLIRGNPGSGKKTLIEELERDCLKDAVVIHLNPFHHTDDYSTMKLIAARLGFKTDQIVDIMNEIERIKKKIVIVLWNFEIFCRSKQGLLYCLTDLTQKGNNISLVAMTCCLDCTEHVEKRVRSRLNTIYYELNYPYRNKEDYIQFASLLLDGHKLNHELKEQLSFMWLSSNRSIRFLKRYLLTLCSLDKGKLVVNLPCVQVGVDIQSDEKLLSQRLNWLTRPQLDLLKVAVAYCCNDNGPAIDFTLLNLAEFVHQRNMKNLDLTSALAYKNIKLLTTIGLLIAMKPDQSLNQFSKFTIGVLPSQLRQVMEKKPECHSMSTDPLWRKLN